MQIRRERDPGLDFFRGFAMPLGSATRRVRYFE
jgi:hypothetical protein